MGIFQTFGQYFKESACLKFSENPFYVTVRQLLIAIFELLHLKTRSTCAPIFSLDRVFRL